MSDHDKDHVRLHRLLKRDLGPAVTKTERGTWVTTSSLPHEITMHSAAGVEFVRVSAGAVVGVRLTKAMFESINDLNVHRALTKRIWIDSKVLVVAEQPLASLRPGDLEHLVSDVLCCARLDAPLLACHSGTVTTEVVGDYVSDLNTWPELLRASGTATERELAVWLDEMIGVSCWIDNDSDPQNGPMFFIGGRGTQVEWPFNLMRVFRDIEDLRDTLQEEQEQEQENDDAGLDEDALLAMTVKDLRALAKEHGVDLRRGVPKAGIVEIILREVGP